MALDPAQLPGQRRGGRGDRARAGARISAGARSAGPRTPGRPATAPAARPVARRGPPRRAGNPARRPAAPRRTAGARPRRAGLVALRGAAPAPPAQLLRGAARRGRAALRRPTGRPGRAAQARSGKAGRKARQRARDVEPGRGPGQPPLRRLEGMGGARCGLAVDDAMRGPRAARPRPAGRRSRGRRSWPAHAGRAGSGGHVRPAWPICGRGSLVACPTPCAAEGRVGRRVPGRLERCASPGGSDRTSSGQGEPAQRLEVGSMATVGAGTVALVGAGGAASRRRASAR